MASATNEHCKEKARAYAHHIQESMQVCKFLLEALYNMNLNKRPPKFGLVGILYKVSQQIRVRDTIKELQNDMA
jgi:hypothetical protein